MGSQMANFLLFDPLPLIFGCVVNFRLSLNLKGLCLKRFKDVWDHRCCTFPSFCCRPLQVEREKVTLMTSLQESQTQLQHTQGALTEQHEKTLRLSQKVIALRRLHRRAHLNPDAHASATSQLHHEALMELCGDEEEAYDEGRTEEDKSETLNKSQVFSYQTPGLEILQCKYRVAVTEVVELKAEVKALHDRLAQCAEGAAGEKPRRNVQLQKLERQAASLEKSCREEREKVTLSY